jgi:hypothetical protein
MRSISVSLLLICSFALCIAQDSSGIASITIAQPKQPVYVNDTVWLIVSITNVSKKDIMIEESHRGAWELEAYDPSDPSGRDLALPLRKENADRGDIDLMVSRTIISPGESVQSRVPVTILSEIFSHPGTYRIVLDKHEWVNNVVIRSNPATIVVAPK